jgi:hypothetical protein
VSESGDRVVTTRQWSDSYANGRRLRGQIHRIRDRGLHPDHPERTHTVRLDEPLGVWEFLTFSADDLMPENDE